jgi:hypothetical protein
MNEQDIMAAGVSRREASSLYGRQKEERAKKRLQTRNKLQRLAFSYLLPAIGPYLLKLPESPQIETSARDQEFNT